MKRNTTPIIPLLLTAFIITLLPAISPAAEKAAVQDADSDISEVTVYRNGAQVTRRASVTLVRGRNEILFTGLTPSLNPQTIQLTGSGDFLILSLSHRQDFLGTHPQQQRLQQLTARRDSLERAVQELETTVSILDRESGILLSNTNLKGNQQNLTAVELKQAMEYFHQKLTELEMQKLEHQRGLTLLRQELQDVRNQISELDNNASRNSSVITAVIQSETGGRIRFTLSYLVSAAGWYPSYDLRVTDIDGPVDFTYKANVYQSSGIDWNDVSLTVTSAVPDHGGTLPQLQPWYLRFYTPQRQLNRATPSVSMDQPSQAKGAVMNEEMELQDRRSQPVPVQEIQSQTSFSYRINLPYSVPSGGKALTVGIGNHDIAADYRYYTVPKLNSRAYLTARVTDWDQYNLLPGDANLFFENTYVGKSAINPNAVGDTLSFSLGRDESIVIEREKLSEFQEKNFFGNRVTETFAWEISVRNSKGQPVRIEVEDQVPVSQHEDIEVSLNETSGADYNRQDGTLRWVLQIPAGATETLRFEYEVEYPRGRPLNF